MAAVQTCTLPQPSAMNSAASRQVLIPPIPEIGRPSVCSSRAISDTMASAMGVTAAEKCCDAVADLASVNYSEVLPFSTGVIGEPLDADRITAALPSAIQNLEADNWQRAAAAILTTDTRPKLRTIDVDVDGKVCRITGMSKGAGMICPNLATMLAFIATDAEIEQSSLDKLLRRANSVSFNRITVDGDTSTNDAVTLSATG